MRTAIAEFVGRRIKGSIMFEQEQLGDSVYVSIHLTGLPPGPHGIHIHEKGVREVCNNPNKSCCDLLGGHFNPYNESHGSYRLGTPRHVGDMVNNVYADSSGNVVMKYYDPLIGLYDNEVNVIGRSVIIHRNKDDEGLFEQYLDIPNKAKRGKMIKESLVTGNSGKRIACAEIIGLS